MYDVVKNVLDLYQIRKAHHVLAFCGNSMYVIKSHSAVLPVGQPHCKPDLVLGYFAYPKPHTEEIKLRGRTIKS